MASRTGWKPGASFSSSRASARSSWTVSRKAEPMGGERGQAFETLGRLGLSQRRAQILAEIARDRQPVHHRTSRGSGLHRSDRIG